MWKGPSPGVQYPGILARGLGLDPGPRPILAAPRPAVQGLSPESAETRHPGLGLGERGGGSKKVEKKKFSELGLPGVEIVPTPQESIFIISRAP